MFLVNGIDWNRFGTFVMEAESGGGNGGEDDTSSRLSPEAERAFNNRLGRFEKNSLALAQQLFQENYQYREKLRQLEPRVAPEGAMILKGEEAKAWELYKALGTPEVVKQGLDERSQFQGELTATRHESLLRRVAEVIGFKYSVLADRDRAARMDQKELEYDIREVEIEGVKQPSVFVKVGGAEKPLLDFAKEQWSDYLPVLQVSQGGEMQNASNATTTTNNGARFIGQSAASGGGKGGVVDQFIRDQEAAAKAVANPLLKSQ